MEAERKFARFDPAIPIVGYFELTNVVTGEFRNREEFLIKNISMGGFNLTSNYPPAIGNPYQVFIHYAKGKHEFKIKIVHSRILRFQDKPEGVFRQGVVYSSGCVIADENESQKALVLEIIKNDCGSTPPAEPKQ
ncbi:MAG: hypothetical protein NTW95_12020 [Candidatus Aminicenantes bacterium]|nr:hypothetical protein [Candidatus Aminicenantes bacterium]